MIFYRCDRCKKEVSYVYEINWRIQKLPPEAQYQPPKSCHLCGSCELDLGEFVKSTEVSHAKS